MILPDQKESTPYRVLLILTLTFVVTLDCNSVRMMETGKGTRDEGGGGAAAAAGSFVASSSVPKVAALVPLRPCLIKSCLREAVGVCVCVWWYVIVNNIEGWCTVCVCRCGCWVMGGGDLVMASGARMSPAFNPA
jgi:hypothetical protein